MEQSFVFLVSVAGCFRFLHGHCYPFYHGDLLFIHGLERDNGFGSKVCRVLKLFGGKIRHQVPSLVFGYCGLRRFEYHRA